MFSLEVTPLDLIIYVPIAVKKVLTFYLFSSTLVIFFWTNLAHSYKCVMVWPCARAHPSM